MVRPSVKSGLTSSAGETLKRCQPVSSRGRVRFARSGHIAAFTIGAALTATVFLAVERFNPAERPASRSIVRELPNSHYDLLAMSPDELDKVDLALMNLVCAKGLPGTESLSIPAVLAKLDQWAETVKSETGRHLYRVTDPKYAEHYNHSEARLRAEFLVQTLQEDCGVHYNMDRVREVDFSKPQDLFIHGMVGSDNGGTCSSMPVFYAALGRRLGYPIRLVLAKQHIFCRWDDGKDRFNFDGATNGGINFHSDEYYHEWPHKITDTEMAAGEFLKSLTPTEELATFLLQRASCLQAHHRIVEERACLAEALQLMPKSSTLQGALRSTLGIGMPVQTTQRPPWNDDFYLPPEVRRPMSPDPQDPTPTIPMPGAGPTFGVPNRGVFGAKQEVRR